MWSDAYIGIPFLAGGRDDRGCDCGGLVLYVLRREKGITALDAAALYGDGSFHTKAGQRALESAVRACLAQWREVPLQAVQPFDLVLYRTIYGVESHCGVAVSARKMLHVEKGRPAHVTDIRPAFSGYTLTRAMRHERLA